MSDGLRTMIEGIREHAAEFASRAAEFEAARQMPDDVMKKLRQLGVFRIVTPKTHGGLELPLSEAQEIFTELARIDGSLGWVCMIGSFSPLLLGFLPRQTYDAIYANGPDIFVCGSVAPAGSLEAVEGGYRLNGRWPFASGSNHADWLFGMCVVTKGGTPVTEGPEGAPMMRIALLPAKQWQVEDSWYVEGLKGTGSNHISARDVAVPAGNVIDPFKSRSNLPGPLFQAGPSLFVTNHSPIAVGIAEGAIQDTIQLADSGKRPVFGRVALKDSQTFQYELGRAEAQLRAARALMNDQNEIDWKDALAGKVHEFDRATRRHQSAVWITEACGQVVESCYRLGGGSAVYESSPLQRRMRDMHAVSQHVSVHLRHYRTSGAQLLGHAPVHPLFAS